MTLTQLLAELDAKKAKATQGDWHVELPGGATSGGVEIHSSQDINGVMDFGCSCCKHGEKTGIENADFIVSLVNSYDQLKAAAIAGERLAEA